MKYHTIIGDVKIRQAQNELGERIWPLYIYRDPYIVKYWHLLYTDFLHCQFALYSDGSLIGTGNSIPVNWQGSLFDLPEQGFDWALEKAATDLGSKLQPNLLVGLQILIEPNLRSKGLSYVFLETMKQIAKSNGFRAVAVPVRPTQKSEYPLISMEDYIHWKDDSGKPFDPWIRVHTNAGGQIVGVCHESMHIPGTVTEWERWSGLTFRSSGAYIDHKGLTPIQVNLSKNTGVYLEPNVWIIHHIDPETSNGVVG